MGQKVFYYREGSGVGPKVRWRGPAIVTMVEPDSRQTVYIVAGPCTAHHSSAGESLPGLHGLWRRSALSPLRAGLAETKLEPYPKQRRVAGACAAPASVMPLPVAPAPGPIPEYTPLPDNMFIPSSTPSEHAVMQPQTSGPEPAGELAPANHVPDTLIDVPSLF